MPKRIDITGNIYGDLKVLEFAHTKRGKAFWRCRCSCGNEVIYESYPLRNGQFKTCGCEKYKGLPKGFSHEPLYSLWWSMKRRCNDKTTDSFKRYGAKGIEVCTEWLDYAEFYRWANLNGYKHGLTLDRIDPKIGYNPDNCRWVDWKTQERNKSNNRLLTLNGETRCVAEWSEISGISPKTIKSRLRLGWSIERTLTEHIHAKTERRNRNGRKERVSNG